jgi:hypothetical protein
MQRSRQASAVFDQGRMGDLAAQVGCRHRVVIE